MTKFHLALILLVFSTNALAANNISLNASAGITLDDNITRAKLNSDAIDDTILNLDFSVDYKLPLNDISKLMTRASLNFNQYQDISRWSFYDLALQLDYQIQPTPGYTSPWFFFAFTIGQLRYDSDQRDGDYHDISLGMVKRLSDIINFRFAVENRSIDADDSTGIFDLDTTRIYLNFDYKLNRHNIIYTTLTRTDGDFITTVLYNSPIIASLGSTPWVKDDFFTSIDWWSYKLDATTLSLLLGYNHAINSNQSIDASVMYYNTDAYADIDYDGIIMQFNYMYRF